jgi:predicted PurR-regulated permease PerM
MELIGAHSALRVGLVIALVVLVLLVLPFLSWLVLAAWLAAAMRPWLAVLARRLGGRSRAAALLTLAFFVALVGPVVALVGSLSIDAAQLGQQLASSASGREALARLVVSDDASANTFDPTAFFTMLEHHGARAIELASAVAGIGAEVTVGLFIFFSASYFLLVEGPAAWRWTILHAPVEPQGLERLRKAFHETGRGLFFGIGVTSLMQAGVATVAYLALGVPRALVLGVVTLFASVLPTIGTALVWVPVSIALAMTGRATAALVLAAVGVLVVSSIDNVLRPILTRRGDLELHPFVVLIAMLGGLALMGAAGLFLGPLLARMAVEIVRMAREAGLVGGAAARDASALASDGAPQRCSMIAATMPSTETDLVERPASTIERGMP